MITLTGLTERQKALADILWSIGSMEEVRDFISKLPRGSKEDAMTVVELMLLEFTDSVDSVDLATQALDKYTL